MTEDIIRRGFIALVGRPNVGKSTLLNRLLGQKLSITTRKPHTTRHRILGIKTVPGAQLIFIDTPGIHSGHKRAINRYMNRTAIGGIAEADVVCFLIDAHGWVDADEVVLQQLKNIDTPVTIAINKIDRLSDRKRLLPLLQHLSETVKFVEAVPVSARRGDSVERLEELLIQRLPQGEAIFPEDQITDRNLRFLAAEFVREQLIVRLGDELPYRLGVEIQSFEETARLATIDAVIWVENTGHKRIIIGNKGELLKRVGSAARVEMEAMFDIKVMLKLWVKVRSGWSDDDKALQQLGYHD